VDFSVIKDWHHYGLNRTLSNLKLETAMHIKEAELEAKLKKQGRDWNQIMTISIVAVVLVIIAIAIVPQVLNTQQVVEDHRQANLQLGTCQGRLNVCQEQIKEESEDQPSQVIPI